MKKIIAMIAALSMVASIGLTCVLAAEPTNVTLNCDVIKLDSADYADTFGEPEGDNVGYILYFTLEGIKDNEITWYRTGSNSATYKYKGRAFGAAGLTLTSDVDNENFVYAFPSNEEVVLGTDEGVVATTFNGLTMEKTATRMAPAGKSNGGDNGTKYGGLYDPTQEAFAMFFVAIPKGVEMNLTPSGKIIIDEWATEQKNKTGSANYATTNVPANLLFAVSYDGEASGSSVITLYEAAGGGGFTPEITEADTGFELENKYVENKADLTDLRGEAVKLSKNYGIAKFSETIDTTAKNYFLHVVDDEEKDADLPINFAEQGIEVENASLSFFAIVRSADHNVVSMTLKAVAKSE